MAHITANDLRTDRPSLLTRVWDAMIRAAEKQSRYTEVQRYNAMSDTELAARGLSRDRIVQHVFRDCIHL